MKPKKRQFLQVDYEIFKLIGKYTKGEDKITIDHLDCLIIERVDDFQKNNMDCYLTNEQFASIFNTSVSTIKRKISNLCKIGILQSNVFLRSDTGKSSRVRTLKVIYSQIGICRSTFNLDEGKTKDEPTLESGTN